jgi:hypothetical protein
VTARAFTTRAGEPEGAAPKDGPFPWLWLAVRAAMSGQVDINAELAAYEARIRDLIDSPPPVFPGLEE